MVDAAGGAGLDPMRIVEAVEDAGFDARELHLRVRGSLGKHEGRPALRLPGPPDLLLLEEGEKLDELERAALPEGTRLELEGPLHPAAEERPASIGVDVWRELEAVEPAG